MMKKVVILGTLLCLSYAAQARKGHIYDLNDSPLPKNDLTVTFNQYQPQYYKGELIWDDWLTPAYDGTRNRARIVADTANPKERFLRVQYPKGGVGPEHSGAQFMIHLPPSDEYWLTFRVRFQPGFDFRLGGKLPGLASGEGKYANGNIPHDGKGWTGRLMWVQEGELVPYLYYVGMPAANKWGDFWSIGTHIKPGQWHTITQHYRLNTAGQSNGAYQVWVDNKPVVQRSDMLWRYGAYGQIDSFLFSTYHGGASAPWAPTRDSWADFDNISISNQMPSYLRPSLNKTDSNFQNHLPHTGKAVNKISPLPPKLIPTKEVLSKEKVVLH